MYRFSHRGLPSVSSKPNCRSGLLTINLQTRYLYIRILSDCTIFLQILSNEDISIIYIFWKYLLVISLYLFKNTWHKKRRFRPQSPPTFFWGPFKPSFIVEKYCLSIIFKSEDENDCLVIIAFWNWNEGVLKVLLNTVYKYDMLREYRELMGSTLRNYAEYLRYMKLSTFSVES